MKIKEATAREVMTRREQLLKKKLIALLRDDGRGHKHPKYAARLEDFIVKIVDSTKDPNMTAAISFDDATIYISDGFLKDPNLFYQLNVLMRHELAHYLMQHQIRMMHEIIKKYGKEGYTHIKMSQSIHSLLNVIEDFEISNKRYSDADKQVVRNMLLNGRLIGGLITEEHRTAWENMSVIDMFKELSNEIEKLNTSIQRQFSYDYLDLDSVGTPNDFIHSEIKGLHFYSDTNHPTNFYGPLAKYIQNKALYHFVPFSSQNSPCIVKFSSLTKEFQDIIIAIEKAINPVNGEIVSKQDVKTMIKEVAKSNPIQVIDVKLPSSGKEIIKLYTPEEKFLAIDALKAMLPELDLYDTWYGKVKKTLGDPKYSTDDLKAVLAALKD